MADLGTASGVQWQRTPAMHWHIEHPGLTSVIVTPCTSDGTPWAPIYALTTWRDYTVIDFDTPHAGYATVVGVARDD